MNSGPTPQGQSPSPEPEIPGDFVSENLRADCARFMDELRELVKIRQEEQPPGTAWLQGDHVD